MVLVLVIAERVSVLIFFIFGFVFSGLDCSCPFASFVSTERFFFSVVV